MIQFPLILNSLFWTVTFFSKLQNLPRRPITFLEIDGQKYHVHQPKIILLYHTILLKN